MQLTPTPTSPKSRARRPTPSLDQYYRSIEHPHRPGPSTVVILIIALLAGAVGGVAGQVVWNASLGNTDGSSTNTDSRPSARNRQSTFLEDVEALADRVRPSAVRLYTATADPSRPDAYRPDVFAGNGVTLTADGLMLTTADVVPDRSQPMVVVTSDRRTYAVQTYLVDEPTGTVFFKVDARGLPVVDFATIDEISVGTDAVLIEDVNARDAQYAPLTVLDPFHPAAAAAPQTSESADQRVLLAPGGARTAGAPVVTREGKLIGLVRDGDGPNLEAIPAVSIAPLLGRVIRENATTRPFLGIRYVDLAWTLDMPADVPSGLEQGAYLIEQDGLPAVVADSAAERAGLRAGDIITGVGDTSVTEHRPLAFLIQQFAPDDSVKLTVRRDGEDVSVVVPLAGPAASENP